MFRAVRGNCLSVPILRSTLMKAHRTRLADPTKILMRRELIAVLAELTRKAKRSPSTRLNLVIFRLATCCGLRASEIAKLQICDVLTEATPPYIPIRNGAAKGRRPRMVPLWWDAGTLEDLRAWKASRLDSGAEYDAQFVAPLHAAK